MGFNTPLQVAEAVSNAGKTKACLPILQMIILGIFAGAYIGFGAELATMVMTGTADKLGMGMTKFIGGAVFSTGLMLVVIGGAELFTGNNLMTIGLSQKQFGIKGLLYNWFFVYVANLIGSVLLVYIMFETNLWQTGGNAVGTTALGIAAGKVNLSFSEAFYRGIGCNWLVCLAVWLAMASQDVVGKIFGIFFPIMAFVASGFEHCVANMYFIPMGILLKGDAAMAAAVAELGAKADLLTWGGFFVNNLIPVTLGNIVGGAVFVG
ncbi:MAG TPA: formate/nitrite transporter family protein, partial [Deltaproteobacteria bacterium]|nr:formate/nitrite transporter family protein [Deltaproteobacteria bacterium]HXK47481.1 formate/nitrite transporter family protein [Deltaproteobacteria bacterium]